MKPIWIALALVVGMIPAWTKTGETADRSTEPALSRPFAIVMEGWEPYYQPFAPMVAAGRPIRWFNPTPSPHTVRHEGCDTDNRCAFDSGAVPPDGQFTISGLPPGVYPYYCVLHPIMRGRLIVRDPTKIAAADRGVGR